MKIIAGSDVRRILRFSKPLREGRDVPLKTSKNIIVCWNKKRRKFTSFFENINLTSAQMISTGLMEDISNSFSETVSEISKLYNLPEEDVSEMLKAMTLSSYVDLTLALQEKDEDRVTKIVDELMKKMENEHEKNNKDF
jgi:DNA-directed RNA polymerase specialized sigma subunit